MENCFGPTLVESLTFSSQSTETIFWIFTEDSGQGHVDAVRRPEPKSVAFIRRQPDCRTAYLQVGTIKELSMTDGPATKADAGCTQVGVSGSGEVEVEAMN